MTLEREEPGIWTAVCDTCGERIVLDADARDDQETAADELDGLGWEALPEEIARFHTDGGTRKRKVTYAEHACPDCR